MYVFKSRLLKLRQNAFECWKGFNFLIISISKRSSNSTLCTALSTECWKGFNCLIIIISKRSSTSTLCTALSTDC